MAVRCRVTACALDDEDNLTLNVQNFRSLLQLILYAMSRSTANSH